MHRGFTVRHSFKCSYQVFSLILLLITPKILELRFGNAMLFKNDSLCEYDLEIFFLKRFLQNLIMQVLISFRSLMSLSSSIKCLTVAFIVFYFSIFKKDLCRFFSILIPFTFATDFRTFFLFIINFFELQFTQVISVEILFIF